MRQLHAGDTALLMNETDDPSQRFNVSVTPDTKVLRTDAALGKNGRCLSKHQSSAAHCPAAQMYEMPVIGVAIAAGVLAHRRDEHAIRKLEISNRERIKKVSHKCLHCLSKSLVQQMSSGFTRDNHNSALVAKRVYAPMVRTTRKRTLPLCICS